MWGAPEGEGIHFVADKACGSNSASDCPWAPVLVVPHEPHTTAAAHNKKKKAGLGSPNGPRLGNGKR